MMGIGKDNSKMMMERTFFFLADNINSETNSLIMSIVSIGFNMDESIQRLSKKFK